MRKRCKQLPTCRSNTLSHNSFTLSHSMTEIKKLVHGIYKKDSKQMERDQEQSLETSQATPDSIVAKPVLIASSAEKWKTKGGRSSLRRQNLNWCNTLSMSHESLAIAVQESVPQKLTSASSIDDMVSHATRSTEQDHAERVAGWAVSFEKLLKDAVGNIIFANFLKMEFSEENIEFWKACEDFKNIVDSTNRKTRAKEIYDKHVSISASEGVNIDSFTRRDVEGQLDDPAPHAFNLAQQQIYQLMKQDSYARFLKSDYYKSALMREMEGKPLQFVDELNVDKLKILKNTNKKEGKKKAQGKENDEKQEGRRSLLPWRQKSKKQAKHHTEATNSASDRDNTNTEIVISATTSKDAVTQNDVVQVEVPEIVAEEQEIALKFCRVIMPDGSTTVVGTRHGKTIQYILGKLCEKRGLIIESLDVLLNGSNKRINLNDDISTLGSKEVYIEHRVSFFIDLPNKQSVGVKEKPNKPIRDVFLPILNKHGYTIGSICAHLFGTSDSLCLDSPVSTLHGLRVIVIQKPSDAPAKGTGMLGCNISATRRKLPNKFTSKFGHRGNTNNYFTNNNNLRSLEERTNGIIDKRDHFLPHAIDDLGILDFDKSQVEIAEVRCSLASYILQNRDLMDNWEALARDYVRSVRGKQRVSSSVQKMTIKNLPNEESPSDRAKQAHDFSSHDQQELVPREVDLPDVLQGSQDNRMFTLQVSEPAAIGSEIADIGYVQTKDMSENETYVEVANDSYALYTLGSNERRYVMDLKNSDIVSKSHCEAANVCGVASSEVVIADSHLADKRLTDAGFNTFGHNKCLVKSRNFEEKEVAKLLAVDKADVPLAPDVPSPEMFSPGGALRNDLHDTTDLAEAAANLSDSSPFSSETSLDKENINTRSKHKSVQKMARHTFLHSSCTGIDSESLLSTVDTDG